MLEEINNAEDLKKLNLEQKNILAQEIREYIIKTVSENGGHLASNLGVVELTIALHDVFDIGKDKIVWDVGHQTYVHKILTGRKEKLKTLRKLNGIAGFPKTSENEADCFNTGHSSTSISAAMGMAVARDLKGGNNSVIAVIGDGALTGGMALEALNHAGSMKTKMIVILNDNEMSISKNIGGVNLLLSKLRSRKIYTRSNQSGRKIIESIPKVGEFTVKVVRRLKKSIKQLIIPKMFFEDIGFKYLGPVDGHNIEDLEYLLSRAKELDEPVLIHVLTKKGKGYKFAEENPDIYHSISSFDIETGKPKKSKKIDYSAVFGKKIIELAENNNKIVAITAAMRDGTGLKEFSQKYPKRFFDVGIAEQHALTFAAGLAKEGMIPFVPIYSSFYQRAYDQVIHDICLQNLPVIMCVDRAGIVGSDGETHQGLYDMAFFNLIPNITIMAPKDFKELEKMMEYAITLKRPVVIRYPRGGESNFKFTKCQDIQLKKAEILRKGRDATIIAIGKTVSKAMEVANILKKDHINVEVINARFLKPIDNYKIMNSIYRTNFVITIEDGTSIGGLGTTIKSLIQDKNVKNVVHKSFAYPDKFIQHGTPEELEKLYGLDAQSIAKYIKYKINLKNKKYKLS